MAMLLEDPMGYMDIKEANDIIEEEANIAAAELVGPNAIDYNNCYERKHVELSYRYLRALGLRLCREHEDLKELLKGAK